MFKAHIIQLRVSEDFKRRLTKACQLHGGTMSSRLIDLAEQWLATIDLEAEQVANPWTPAPGRPRKPHHDGLRSHVELTDLPNREQLTFDDATMLVFGRVGEDLRTGEDPATRNMLGLFGFSEWQRKLKNGGIERIWSKSDPNQPVNE